MGIFGQGESSGTLVLTVKMQRLEIFYFWKFDIKFGFKSIELAQWYTIFNQQGQKWGKFMFTFPHPSPNGTSVPADST